MRSPDFECDGVKLFLGDCLDVLPTLIGDHCASCGHEWRLHLNTNACCQVVGKDESSEPFEGGTRYCLCDELPTSGVDAVVTDPPYGLGRENHGGFLESRPMLTGDDSTEVGEAALSWCRKNELPTAAFASPRLPWSGRWRNYICWDKGGAVAGGGDVTTCLKLSWELIQVARNPPLCGGRDTSVWRCGITQEDFEFHPTQKPVTLIVRLLSQVFGTCPTILDPFMGSGTTGVACIRTGRKFIGIEKEPRYFEIAVKRITDELKRNILFEPAPKITQRSLLE